jgi:hypothetical protein
VKAPAARAVRDPKYQKKKKTLDAGEAGKVLGGGYRGSRYLSLQGLPGGYRALRYLSLQGLPGGYRALRYLSLQGLPGGYRALRYLSRHSAAS